MIKLIKLMVILSSTVLAVACDTFEMVVESDNDNIVIVAGQSNATYCDWSYFEEASGYSVFNMSIPGYSISQLSISIPDNVPDSDFIIFVHGETDAKWNTDLSHYVYSVEKYRKTINQNAHLVISSVGYNTDSSYERFDNLREAVELEAQKNPTWTIGFEDAKHFVEWGWLVDNVHFSNEGCQLMMDEIIYSIEGLSPLIE